MVNSDSRDTMALGFMNVKQRYFRSDLPSNHDGFQDQDSHCTRRVMVAPTMDAVCGMAGNATRHWHCELWLQFVACARPDTRNHRGRWSTHCFTMWKRTVEFGTCQQLHYVEYEVINKSDIQETDQRRGRSIREYHGGYGKGTR